MRVLFIGGTGNISTASSELAVERGMELFLLNRGETSRNVPGAQSIVADIKDRDAVAKAIRGMHFDAVVDWIAFTPDDVKRDFELFRDVTDQYVFISSASCYQRPPGSPFITESTPLRNDFWQYSRNKIACEDYLNARFREDGFPITIVRPSLTYQYVIPLPVRCWRDYTIIDRMKRGEPVVVHGDGSSLWTITHSEDFAIGFVGLLGHREAVGEAFHITSDEILTWDQIYRQAAEAAGCEAKIVHVPSDFLAAVDDSLTGSLVGDKATSTIFDNAKLKRFVPEFTATIRWRTGIERTLRWFEEDPARMVIDKANDELVDRILAEYGHAGRQGMR